LQRDASHYSELEVAPIAIHLAYRWVEVEQVSFHRPEDWIVCDAILPPSVLPALTLMAYDPGGNDVFPLNTIGAILLSTSFIAARSGINRAA